MPGSGPLAVERRGDALLVGFNRPEKRNAIDRAVDPAAPRYVADPRITDRDGMAVNNSPFGLSSRRWF